ncbi:hypothetical protein IMSAGC013_01245 [Lachnospiraceae bacterium]|nr:hypothetical protein IMSAGC013_01245 [Lachnospiraceae bacterium]
MKKIVSAVIVLAFLCLLLGIGCHSGSGKGFGESSETAGDFVAFLSAPITASPEGYYIVQRGFVYYVSHDFQKSTIVCDKLECIHNDEGVENLWDYYECNAYVGVGGTHIYYYKDALYVTGSSMKTSGMSLYKLSLDGTERTVLYDKGTEINGFAIYEGMAYVGDKAWKADSVVHTIRAFPAYHPEKEEILYETAEYPEHTINQMKCMDGFCYFYLFDPADTGRESVYLKVDLESGETEKIHEPMTCRIELGKDISFLMEQKDISYEPYDKEKKYYRAKKGEDWERLTEEDFISVGKKDNLRGLDKKYVYFMTDNWLEVPEPVPEDDYRVRVYEHDGTLAAEIPTRGFGSLYYLFPGTEKYMFLSTFPEDFNPNSPMTFYYVDKSQFHGGIVEPKRIEMGK